VIGRGRILYSAAALCAVAVSACGSNPDSVRAQEQGGPPDIDLRGLGIDELKGGFYVLQFVDGSMLSHQDGIFRRNGMPISCAELKTTLPRLFQQMAGRPPVYDDECQFAK
jgi:hypothetical protein